MPTTRKQKKARKSRGLEMLSDIENLDILLGERHSEREESVNSNSVRMPESANSDMFENNEEKLYLNHREMGLDNDTNPGQNSTRANSNAEINKLSIELNSRLSREMDEMINSVNTQIQRAISYAVNNQILPQIQNAQKAGSGLVTQNRWNIPVERPEINAEDYRNEKIRNSSRSEPVRDRRNDNYEDQAYDTGKKDTFLCFFVLMPQGDPSRGCLNFLHAAWKYAGYYFYKTWKFPGAWMENIL